MIDWSWPLLGTAFAAVFVSELVGDRTMFAVGALAARWRPLPVFLGTLPAFAAKAGAAVLFGRTIARLPGWLVATVSALTFAGAAIAAWRDRAPDPAPEPPSPAVWRRGALGGFLAVFLTEWADVGQLTTAALAARFGLPTVVWVGAVLALATKSLLAATLGLGLRRYVARPTLRLGATALCVVLAVLAALRVD
jgi:putative Ca2+/H+ antiporter (TMEM165/GDT1 family)